MKIVLLILALIIAALFAPMFLSPPADNQSGEVVTGLPWQIDVLPDGSSTVFGLTLGKSTLEDIRLRLGNDMELAVVAAPGEPGNVEAYFPDATLGAVTGKLIATAEIDTASVEAMRLRAAKREYMQSSTKKWTLAPEDTAKALAAPIRSLAVVPAINLEEAVLIQRFGVPKERIRANEHSEHFLYPDRGLDIVLDSKGKEVLQYIAPRNFSTLRDPLVNKSPADEGAPQ